MAFDATFTVAYDPLISHSSLDSLAIRLTLHFTPSSNNESLLRARLETFKLLANQVAKVFLAHKRNWLWNFLEKEQKQFLNQTADSFFPQKPSFISQSGGRDKSW